MKYFESRWRKTGLVLGVILTLVLIVNTTYTAYIAVDDSFTASIQSRNQIESLDVQIRGTVGRPSPLSYILGQVRSLLSSYYVGGVQRSNAETGIHVTLTGTNVGSSASVDYYIEAQESGATGNKYRFLEGNSTSVSVGGAPLDLNNQTTIENHLQAMGLSTDTSHEINYYVYVKAETTGAVSGETLTSEITKTLFDTVTYQWGSPITGNINAELLAEVREESPTTSYPSPEYPWIMADAGAITYLYVHFDLSDVAAISVAQYFSRVDQMYYTSNSDWMLHSIGSFDNSVTWDTQPSAISQLYLVNEQLDMGWHSWQKSAILSYLQSMEGEDVFLRMSKGDDMNRRSFYGSGSGGASAPYLRLTYVGFSASWYPVGPVSVLSLPLGQTLGALSMVTLACYLVYNVYKETEK